MPGVKKEIFIDEKVDPKTLKGIQKMVKECDKNDENGFVNKVLKKNQKTKWARR